MTARRVGTASAPDTVQPAGFSGPRRRGPVLPPIIQCSGADAVQVSGQGPGAGGGVGQDGVGGAGVWRTDGVLIKENLAREAGVSHATVHRATTVLAEWNTHVPHPVRGTPTERTRDDTIAALHTQLAQARRQARELQGQLDALATVTAHL